MEQSFIENKENVENVQVQTSKTVKKRKKNARKKQKFFHFEKSPDLNASSVRLSKVRCLCKQFVDIECVRKHFEEPFHKALDFQKEVEKEFYEYVVELKSEWKQIEFDYNEALSCLNRMNFSFINRSMNLYYKHVKPKPRHIQKRLQFKNTLLSYIRELWPDAQIHLFGSSVTEIVTETSDIDVCLILSCSSEVEIIKKLASHFKKRKIFVKPILKARVPILKCFAPCRNIEFAFDLSVNRILGYENSLLLKEYFNFDHRVRPLAFLLKDWISFANIRDSSTSFSSYSLHLLLIFYLQTLPIPVLPNFQQNASLNPRIIENCNLFWEVDRNWHSENGSSTGELLVGFFLFICSYNFEKLMVSIRLGKPHPKPSHFESYPIVIEDPFEIDFNCSRLISYETLQLIVINCKIAFSRLIFSGDINSLFLETFQRDQY